MIDITIRNGPLVIFCQLVLLAEIAVPLDQCRMALKDIEEVWDLQRKLIEDQRLPLHPASDTIWEELGRLRGQVNDLCCRNVGEDRGILLFLQRLLGTIKTIVVPKDLIAIGFISALRVETERVRKGTLRLWQQQQQQLLGIAQTGT
jgi:hypothetical protein